MFCKYCGKEIADDSRFCKHCGKELNEAKAEVTETETKLFTFGGMSYNQKNIAKINEWLATQKIIIKAVNVNAFMNINLPLKWETVVNRVEIKYTVGAGGKKYCMGFFKSKKWIGSSYAKVNAAFEQWKKENPGRTVVWDQCMGHQAEGGSTQSLYFLYY